MTRVAYLCAVALVPLFWACHRHPDPAPVGVTWTVDPEESMPAPEQGQSKQSEAQPQRPLTEEVSEGPSGPLPLPVGTVTHKIARVNMPGDRAIRLAHAEAGQEKVFVYLHGMCGNPKGIDAYSDLFTNRGTLLIVGASIPCEDRPGYRWPQEPALIESRIRTALERTKELRGGQLDLSDVILVGYSQGAHRAEKLAAAYPKRYRLLLMGGTPTAPKPEMLHSVHGVAVLGGELEDTSHMERGERALRDAGIRSRFFWLPQAHHGDYGPDGRRVLKESLSWLMKTEPAHPAAHD